MRLHARNKKQLSSKHSSNEIKLMSSQGRSTHISKRLHVYSCSLNRRLMTSARSRRELSASGSSTRQSWRERLPLQKRSALLISHAKSRTSNSCRGRCLQRDAAPLSLMSTLVRKSRALSQSHPFTPLMKADVFTVSLASQTKVSSVNR